MCLYPRFIKNKRYLAYNSKRPNQGAATAVPCDDYRKLYVPIGCGNCYECRRQKAQAWRVRLIEELKVQNNPLYVTLTFSNENLQKLHNKYNKQDYNELAQQAVRLFLERYRKKNKKSLRHWLITELGHEGTERIHLHGIIFPTKAMNEETLQSYWEYGYVDIGDYCNLQTINYIVKYVTKIDTEHKGYMPKIFCSPGIGANFIDTYAAKNTYKYRPNKSAEYYLLNNGQKVALPIYYRNKLYTQEERDKMWTERLDKGEIFVNRIRVRNVNTDKGHMYYNKLLADQQEWNKKIGYGDNSAEWSKKSYKITFDILNARTSSSRT